MMPLYALPTTVLIIGVLMTFYIVAVLRFNEFEVQPFETNRKIKFNKEVEIYGTDDLDTVEMEYNAGLFDYIRALFGLYNRSEEVWVINEKRLPMWRCPKCLSFWVSIFVALSIIFIAKADISLLILFVPSFAGGSTMLHTWLNN